MANKGMALIDLGILRVLADAEFEIRAIMLLSRQLQGGEHVIDAGTLKAVEDLLFVAGTNLASAHLRVVARLEQYRDLAEAAMDAVSDFEESDGPTWPQVFSVKADYRPDVANDPLMGVVS